MNSPLISVIVPVYNTEKYLDQCIQSVLAQTYTNWELLLIDDGSTDSSGAICDKYAAQDNRIRVFHKENGGVSSARNLGLDNAQGEWISFIDADDTVETRYIEHLVSHVKGNIDLVICSANIKSSNTSFQFTVEPMCFSSLNLNLALVKNDLHAMTAPWSKLFRHKLIKQSAIYFQEDVHLGEDAIFLFQYIQQAEFIVITSERLYNYAFENAGSLTKQVHAFQSEYKGYSMIKSVIDGVQRRGNITIKEAVDKLNWMIGFYTRRVINAMYFDNELSMRQRLVVLRTMDFTSYLDYVHIPSFKEKLLAWLLSRRMFYTYDICRVLIRKAKKLFMV